MQMMRQECQILSKKTEGTTEKASLSRKQEFLKLAQEQPNKHRRNRPNAYENFSI